MILNLYSAFQSIPDPDLLSTSFRIRILRRILLIRPNLQNNVNFFNNKNHFDSIRTKSTVLNKEQYKFHDNIYYFKPQMHHFIDFPSISPDPDPRFSITNQDLTYNASMDTDPQN